MSEDERLNIPDAGDDDHKRRQRSAIWCIVIITIIAIVVLIISLVLRHKVAENLPDNIHIATPLDDFRIARNHNGTSFNSES